MSGRRGGLVSAHWTPDREVRVEPWPGHCVVFLGRALHSHSASHISIYILYKSAEGIKWNIFTVSQHPFCVVGFGV